MSLTWTAATDNIGVTAYDVRRNGTTVGSPTMTSFTDTGLTANTAYTYTVVARDAAGNASSASAPLSVTTSAGSGSGEAVSYEAESSGNTLAGGAVVASSANCSGGAKVGYVGNGGTLTFNNVSSGSSGDFVLSLVYLAAETRGVQVTINNGTPVTLSLPSSGGWDTLATYDLTVSLNAGTNTIRLANPGGWAPDFDRIILSTGGGVISGAAYDAIDADMVDMETYAVLRAARRFGVPTIGLRGISDGRNALTGMHDWREYLHVLDEKLAAAIAAFRRDVASGRFTLNGAAA